MAVTTGTATGDYAVARVESSEELMYQRQNIVDERVKTCGV